MNNSRIRKVKVLQGIAKVIATEHCLDPDDLVIVTTSLEKVIRDPVSYLLGPVGEEREKFWFEVEGGCLDCRLRCWIEVPGDDPECPLVQSSIKKETP